MKKLFTKNYSKNIATSNSDKTAASKIFKDKSIPKISEADKASCEGQITIQELGKALKELKMANLQVRTALQQTFINFSG
jgi:triphosphoribosyl-dephospho-CoA synthetase